MVTQSCLQIYFSQVSPACFAEDAHDEDTWRGLCGALLRDCWRKNVTVHIHDIKPRSVTLVGW